MNRKLWFTIGRWLVRSRLLREIAHALLRRRLARLRPVAQPEPPCEAAPILDKETAPEPISDPPTEDTAIMQPTPAPPAETPAETPAKTCAPPSVADELERGFAALEAELRRAGRWRPEWDRPELKRFVVRLLALAAEQAVSDDPFDPAAWFADFLRALPPVAPMGEEAAPGASAQTPAPRFAETPTGPARPVSAASLDLHRRAAAIAQARPGLTYAQALAEASRK